MIEYSPKSEASSSMGSISAASAATDIDLAEKAGRGDRGAFEALVWRWWDRIRGFCSAISGFDQEIAEDAAQEALIQIHRSLPKWKKSGSLGSFFYGICRNVTKNMIRRAARTRSRQVYDADLSFVPADPGGSAEDLVVMKDLKRQLTSAMRSLDIQDRELIYLHDAEDMAIKDLSILLDLPEGTVKSRLFRIRKKLAMVFKEAGYD